MAVVIPKSAWGTSSAEYGQVSPEGKVEVPGNLTKDNVVVSGYGNSGSPYSQFSKPAPPVVTPPKPPVVPPKNVVIQRSAAAQPMTEEQRFNYYLQIARKSDPTATTLTDAQGNKFIRTTNASQSLIDALTAQGFRVSNQAYAGNTVSVTNYTPPYPGMTASAGFRAQIHKELEASGYIVGDKVVEGIARLAEMGVPLKNITFGVVEKGGFKFADTLENSTKRAQMYASMERAGAESLAKTQTVASGSQYVSPIGTPNAVSSLPKAIANSADYKSMLANGAVASAKIEAKYDQFVKEIGERITVFDDKYNTGDRWGFTLEPQKMAARGVVTAAQTGLVVMSTPQFVRDISKIIPLAAVGGAAYATSKIATGDIAGVASDAYNAGVGAIALAAGGVAYVANSPQKASGDVLGLILAGKALSIPVAEARNAQRLEQMTRDTKVVGVGEVTSRGIAESVIARDALNIFKADTAGVTEALKAGKTSWVDATGKVLIQTPVKSILGETTQVLTSAVNFKVSARADSQVLRSLTKAEGIVADFSKKNAFGMPVPEFDILRSKAIQITKSNSLESILGRKINSPAARRFDKFTVSNQARLAPAGSASIIQGSAYTSSFGKTAIVSDASAFTKFKSFVRRTPAPKSMKLKDYFFEDTVPFTQTQELNSKLVRTFVGPGKTSSGAYIKSILATGKDNAKYIMSRGKTYEGLKTNMLIREGENIPSLTAKRVQLTGEGQRLWKVKPKALKPFEITSTPKLGEPTQIKSHGGGSSSAVTLAAESSVAKTLGQQSAVSARIKSLAKGLEKSDYAVQGAAALSIGQVLGGRSITAVRPPVPPVKPDYKVITVPGISIASSSKTAVQALTGLTQTMEAATVQMLSPATASITIEGQQMKVSTMAITLPQQTEISGIVVPIGFGFGPMLGSMVPPVGSPSRGLEQRGFSVSRKARTAPRYAPSLYAIFYNIRARRKPGSLTGAEVRPIIGR